MANNSHMDELLKRWRHRAYIPFQQTLGCMAIEMHDFPDANILHQHAKDDGLDTLYLGNYFSDDAAKVFALFRVGEQHFALPLC